MQIIDSSPSLLSSKHEKELNSSKWSENSKKLHFLKNYFPNPNEKINSSCLLGSKKFFLYNEFVNSKLMSKIPEDEDFIYENFVDKNANFIAKQRYYDLKEDSPSIITMIGSAVIGSATGSVALGVVAVVLGLLYDRSKANEWKERGGYVKEIFFWRLMRLQEAIMEKSIKDILKNSNKIIQIPLDLHVYLDKFKKDMLEGKLRYDLYFDIQDKKLEWIKDCDNTKKRYMPIFNFEIENKMETFSYKVIISPDSPINDFDCETIPFPGFSFTAQDYDENLRKLIQNYISFLDCKMEDKELSQDNPFRIIKNCRLLLGNNDNLISLAFPEKLLESVEKMLVSKDALFPYYQFLEKEGKLQLIYKDASPFTIAEFDPLTLKSFQDSSKEANWNPNEFLIQAMYSSFANKPMGLPGKDSVELKNGWLAPQEVPFKGLYSILEQFPDKMVHYDSREISPNDENQFSKILKKRPIF